MQFTTELLIKKDNVDRHMELKIRSYIQLHQPLPKDLSKQFISQKMWIISNSVYVSKAGCGIMSF